MKVFSFRNLRITILLILLALAAIYAQDQRLNTTSWYKPITVTIFPINGDGQQRLMTILPAYQAKTFRTLMNFLSKMPKNLT